MPSATRNRRDSRARGEGLSESFARSTGVTAIELMVVVAVVAVIATLAVPSFNDARERQQLIAAAERVASFVSSAQMDAVMRGEPMTLSYDRSDTDNWCLGLSQGAQACDCTQWDQRRADFCSVHSEPRILSAAEVSNRGILDQALGDGALTFDPVAGVLADPRDQLELGLISNRGDYALTVKVAPDGQIRICSSSSGGEVPGFRLC